MKADTLLWRRLIQFGPLVLVAAVAVVKEFARIGLWHIVGFQWQVLVIYGLFLAGGALGFFLEDIDIFVKRYRIQISGTERMVTQWTRAVRNVLTCAVLAVCGIWVVSSSTSPFSWGVVFALQLRLYSELLFDKDYMSWYWVFARGFTHSEHKVFMLVWGVVLVSQFLILL